MRLLVFGASGFIGTWVCRMAKARGCAVTGTHYSRECCDVRADITNFERVQQLIADAKPDQIISLAGPRNIEWSERFPAEAERIHARGTANIAAAAATEGIPLLFISTDAVFDGTQSQYDEEAVPAPVNQYGRVKLLAEHAVLDASSANVVIRSSLVFGWNEEGQASNTVADVIRSLRAGKAIALPPVFSNPIAVDEAAATIVSAALCGLRGLFHLGGAAGASRYDLGVAAAEEFGLDPSLVIRASSVAAPRPLNTVLNTQRLERAIGLRLSSYVEGLRRMRMQEPRP